MSREANIIRYEDIEILTQISGVVPYLSPASTLAPLDTSRDTRELLFLPAAQTKPEY